MRSIRAGMLIVGAAGLALTPSASGDDDWKAAPPHWKASAPHSWSAAPVDAKSSNGWTMGSGGWTLAVPDSAAPTDRAKTLPALPEAWRPLFEATPGRITTVLEIKYGSADWVEHRFVIPEPLSTASDCPVTLTSSLDADQAPGSAKATANISGAIPDIENAADTAPSNLFKAPPDIGAVKSEGSAKDDATSLKIPVAQGLPPDVKAIPAAVILPPEEKTPSASLVMPANPVLPTTPTSSTSVASYPDFPFLAPIPWSNPRLAVSEELLIWWIKGDRVPPLATTGTPDSLGVLGQPGTLPLFGPGSVNQGQREGSRTRLSWWLDDEPNFGLDAAFFFLGANRFNFVANSNIDPVISRPVFVLNNNQENAETVAFPGVSSGQLRIDGSSQFWGAEANVLKRICGACDRNFEVFAGYRFLYLDEKIGITESITAGPNAPDPAGTQVIVRDQFNARNEFHGAQIGAHYEQRWNRFFVEVRGSFAMGVNVESLDISGSQMVTRPGQPTQNFLGGLLAAPTNIGNHGHDCFSIAPEIGLNAGYQITQHVRVFAGYNFLYWSNVLRPGQQIDRVVDLSQIPNTPAGIPSTGQQRPGVLLSESNFWAQGVTFGLQWLW
jgi:hypothetical protein